VVLHHCPGYSVVLVQPPRELSRDLLNLFPLLWAWWKDARYLWITDRKTLIGDFDTLTGMTREIAEQPRAKDVPLRTGLPTREELLVYYPAKFTWNQLKTFVNSGYAGVSPLKLRYVLNASPISEYRDLGLLKRDKKLQRRYDEWAVGIVAKYGSLGQPSSQRFLFIVSKPPEYS
jgi:hypothetical protein